MKFGEAMTAAAFGRIVRRPGWHGTWHCRVFAPVDSRNPQPRLLMADGWPYAVCWNPPDFDSDDLLADDWQFVDPAAAVQSQAPEVVWRKDEDED